MPQVFEVANLSSLELRNRLIHSATFECMADESGAVTDDLIKRYVNLAKGEVGLIIPGYLYVHPRGKAFDGQTGIHDDRLVPGLKRLVKKEASCISCNKCFAAVFNGLPLRCYVDGLP